MAYAQEEENINMHLLFSRTITTIGLFFCSVSIAWACTDIRLIAQDNTVLVTRTMEFSMDLKSNIMSTMRQKEFNVKLLNGKQGQSWKAKYGYVFIDGFNMGVALDGMNEEGLSFEALLFPGEAEYQEIPENEEQNAIPYFYFGDWILGNFKTVDEVKTALKKVYVYSQPLPELNDTVFPLHFSIQDKSGKGIVVEYVKGELNIYDNVVGVLTNSPTYDWHLTNLRNYVNLSPVNPKPIVDNGMTFSATGQGAGMLGLPGDISPPSRFVKMAVMLKTVQQPKDAMEALNISQHIINNVDIPLGFVREAQQENTATNELTQWVVFKDLTNKKIFYRTYNDSSLRVINFAELNFSEKLPSSKLSMAHGTGQFMIDMTAEFIVNKS